MTLRKATLLLTGLGALALMLAVAVITHVTIQASFADIERAQTRKNMERGRYAVEDELQKLDTTVLDWAAWDDANKFMLTQNREFVTSSLNDRSLLALRLAAIIFLDRTGHPVWMQAFDTRQGTKMPMPAELLALLKPGSPVLVPTAPEERRKGLVLLPQGVIFLASCPITSSEGTGPSSGTLVMARSLDKDVAAEIAERVRLPLSFERADSPVSADVSVLAQAAGHGMATGPLSDGLYGGVQVLSGIAGSPVLRLVLREPRDIMTRGSAALTQSHLWATAGALAFLAMLLLFLERRVLRRLTGLKDQVEAIGAEVDEATTQGRDALGPAQVEMPGGDELSALAQRINETLAELERSRRNLSTQCTLTLEQESYLQQILNSIQAGVILVDPETRLIREVNAFAAASTGRTREEIVGRLCHGFIAPNGQGQCPIMERYRDNEQSMVDLPRADGTSLPVLRSVSQIERGGQPLLLETFINVEELQNAQDALKRSEETYRAVFMNTGTATLLIEPDTTIRLANQEFEKLSGYTRADVEGIRRWTEFFLPEDVEWMLRHHAKRRLSPDLAPRNYEAHFLNRRGETRVGRLTVGMIPGTLISVASIEDITERKEAEDQLRHQAFHDTLTGLPNRQLLLDRLERSVASAQREGHEVAVLLMDLDRFKDINDSLGHSAGDRLLKLVAARLENCVRHSDTMARFGGDEFVLVVDDPVGEAAAGMVAQHVLDCFAPPFDLDGQSLHMRLSIGVALFTGRDETPEELLKNADLAMYRAKERGRNTYEFFTKDLNDQVVQRLAVEAGLRRALDDEGIEVFYQPKVCQPGKHICGAEALVRWRREDGALVGPAEFIPVAENTGLILPLSNLVLRQACRQAVLWRQGLHKDLVMAVNLSPRQFAQPGLAQRIADILQETGLPPEALELEITENLLLDIRPETLDTLHALRDMGCCVVLDDFGKEYSSLSYIKKLPIQAIKIDRSFISDLPRDVDDAAIVQTILSMAKNLELRVVAEGVETAEQLEFLLGLGCDEFQGYYFSKPLPNLDMERLLDQVSPFTPAT
ncbi:MAG: EAL domain-containing protein [Humidesulfovibrio sp.]|nr:EAL domain-containing protein [Humidesulfovibrio sp.]